MSQFANQFWSHKIYGEFTESIPPSAELACGRGMHMTIWVDLDHDCELITHWSKTGYLIIINGYPIYWFSKKIPSIEISNFGDKLCVKKQATEHVCGLRYKLITKGLPCDEPTYIFGDNQSVFANTSAPAPQFPSTFFVKEWYRINGVPLMWIRTTKRWIWLPKLFPRRKSNGSLCAEYFDGFMPKSRSTLRLYGMSEALGIFIFYFMDWV